jgi:hypothetical protein
MAMDAVLLVQLRMAFCAWEEHHTCQMHAIQYVVMASASTLKLVTMATVSTATDVLPLASLKLDLLAMAVIATQLICVAQQCVEMVSLKELKNVMIIIAWVEMVALQSAWLSLLQHRCTLKPRYKFKCITNHRHAA